MFSVFTARIARISALCRSSSTFRKLLGIFTLVAAFFSSACAQISSKTLPVDADGANKPDQERLFDNQNRRLIAEIRAKGVKDEKVLNALSSVPRHRFVTAETKASSYDDNPLPIGSGQTISQPFIVAYMTEALDLKPNDRVLEIGTGSGYQACVLSRLVHDVYSIEIIKELGETAKEALNDIGVNNVHVRIGDGYQGWPEEGPFDAIIITAAPPEIPQELVNQLKVGGRLIVPVGKSGTQWLKLLTKKADGKIEAKTLIPVRFVPMVHGKNNMAK